MAFLGCSALGALACLWLSLCLGLVLLSLCRSRSGLWCFLLPCFPFQATSQGPITSGLRTAGVAFQLPDGRDVGSKQGHRPKNRYFQVYPMPFLS